MGGFFLFGNVNYCFYISRNMIELIEEYQNKGHDVCFMITCAGSYVFEHYVDGKLKHDVIADDEYKKSYFNAEIADYLCELKDMS